MAIEQVKVKEVTVRVMADQHDERDRILALESRLVSLKDRVAYYRRSLEEVNRSTEWLTADSPTVLAGERTVRELPGR